LSAPGPASGFPSPGSSATAVFAVALVARNQGKLDGLVAQLAEDGIEGGGLSRQHTENRRQRPEDRARSEARRAFP